MKPPTEDALRYAATVLGRDVTQLERLVERELPGPPRDQLAKMLAHVRSVRTWILGVQMPIAQRRERRERAKAGNPITTSPGPMFVRQPCTECGELMAHDHTVCFFCATGTRPAAQCSDCGATLAHVIGPNVKGTVCPECNPDSSMFDDHDIDCRCSECASEPLSRKDLKALKAAVAPLLPRQK